MIQTPFSSLLRDLSVGEGGLTVQLPQDWLQGRTAYGGISAALCLEAGLGCMAALPPLRSAQFAFIGPAAGQLRLRPSILRQGRSSIFVGVDLEGEAGLATRALFCFGAHRDSTLDYVSAAAPLVQGWDDCPPYFQPTGAPNFASHFDSRLADGARPRTPGSNPRMVVWMRHRDVEAQNTLTGLIALADALPPAAMVLFKGAAPISTMTWSVDMLTDSPLSETGWWLMASTAETTRDGYSAQSMTLWDDHRRPVVAARQMVAIFS
jgi:Thioesterase-like superfamily